jgi:hypothetical protein
MHQGFFGMYSESTCKTFTLDNAFGSGLSKTSRLFICGDFCRRILNIGFIVGVITIMSVSIARSRLIIRCVRSALNQQAHEETEDA